MSTDYEFEVEEFDFPAEFESDEEFSRLRRMPARSIPPRVSVPRPMVARPRPRPIPPRRPKFPRPIVGRRIYLYAPESPAASEYVRWVQTMLNQALNLQLPVDGVMSVQTRSAIRSFQEKNGMPVTGIVGPDTERALMNASAGQLSVPQAVQGSEPAGVESVAPQATPDAQPTGPGEGEGHNSQLFEVWQGEFEREENTFSLLPTGASGPFKDWVWPLPVWNGRKPVISNGFDPRPDPRFGKKHGGVDVMYRRLPNEPAMLPDGTKGYFVPSDRIPVLAVGSGVVVQSGKNPLGHSVIIDHGNGYHTFYQHLTAKGLPPKSTRIAAGTPIGFVGYNPVGYQLNHLHFEIWPGGSHARSVDPGPILRGLAIRPEAPAPASGGSAAAGATAADALRRGLWSEAIRLAIQQGVRDENRLTDMVFHARHPELQGRRLRADERPLVQEWLDIRDRMVRPVLKTILVGNAPLTTPQPAAATPTVSQDVVLGLDTASVAGNKNPDWLKAKTDAAIRFAIIRSNWGTWEDSVFKRDWPRIKDAGMVRGAYLFLRFPHPKHNMTAPDPVAQAKALIKTVGPLDKSDLPPTLDVEFPGGRSVTRLTAQQCLDQVRAAWKVLKDYYGVAPLIYTSARVWKEDLNNLPAPDLVESPLWLARYPFGKGPAVYDARVSRLNPPPVPPPWGDSTSWWIHQYQGDAVRLPGFSTGDVDLNRFNPLQKGASGDRVKWVQRRLGIAQNGQCDEAMERALRAFQNRNGLAATGAVDVQTFAYLCWSNP